MGRKGCAVIAVLLGAWLALVAGPAASAPVYQCKGRDGERVYSDSGCVARGTADRPVATGDDPLHGGRRAAPAAPASSRAAEPAVMPDVPVKSGREIPQEDDEKPPRPDAAGDVPQPPPRDPALQSARQMIPGFRIAFVAGVSLLLLSYILMFVGAFRDKLKAWGITLVLFAPVTMLLYPVFHWRRARKPFAMLLVGGLLAAGFYVPPVDMITVGNSYLSSRPGKYSSRLAVTNSFATKDIIYLRTELEWDDPWVQTGHRVTWLWYTGDRQREEVNTRLRFKRSPFVLQGNLPATDLGPGQHRVEIYVDGRRLDSRSFQIRP